MLLSTYAFREKMCVTNRLQLVSRLLFLLSNLLRERERATQLEIVESALNYEVIMIQDIFFGTLQS